ncbi:MAG: sigma 54-interacting transcriptional regulator, partial [Nitrospirota bacterium]
MLGESGVGKEILARSIHAWSPRAAKPFVAVNCVALSDHLLESEQFGHEKWSFTGAMQQKKVLLEVAQGGTVFLDEIGDMKPDLQAKLLRVLQDHEFERVGGTHPIRVDIRVIAATNQDLKTAVRGKRFRKDLFFRLNVVGLTIPPLRERRDDVPALERFLVTRYSKDMKRPPMAIDPTAMALLQEYDWPGNVRELGNVIGRAVVLATE